MSLLYAIYKKLTSNITIKGYEKIYHENINQKNARLAVLIANKVDFRTKKISRDRHYVMTKGSVYQEDIAVLNV